MNDLKREKRIVVHLNGPEEDRLAEAARKDHRKLADFVRVAAVERAERILNANTQPAPPASLTHAAGRKV